MLICVGSQSEGIQWLNDHGQMIENGLLFFFSSNSILILFLTSATSKTVFSVFCIGILVDSITAGILSSAKRFAGALVNPQQSHQLGTCLHFLNFEPHVQQHVAFLIQTLSSLQ